MGGFGRTVTKQAAKSLAGIGVAAAAGAQQTVQEFAKIEREANKVFTLLPGISQKRMGEMKRNVSTAALATGQSLETSFQAAYDSISAGIPEEDIKGFLRDTSRLAAAAGTDISTATDALTTIRGAWKLSADDMGDASDTLFGIVKQGKTTVDELAGSIGKVAGIAGSAGVELDDLGAILAGLTKGGYSTDEAMTAVRAAISELTKGTGTLALEFKAISGQTFNEFIKSGGTLAEALSMVGAEAERTGRAVPEMASNIRAAAAISVAATAAGREELTRDLAAIRDAQGLTAEGARRIGDDTQAGFDKAKAAAQVGVVAIGESLSGVFGEIAHGIERLFLDAEQTLDVGLERIALRWALTTSEVKVLQKDARDYAKEQLDLQAQDYRANTLDYIAGEREKRRTEEELYLEFLEQEERKQETRQATADAAKTHFNAIAAQARRLLDAEEAATEAIETAYRGLYQTIDDLSTLSADHQIHEARRSVTSIAIAAHEAAQQIAATSAAAAAAIDDRNFLAAFGFTKNQADAAKFQIQTGRFTYGNRDGGGSGGGGGGGKAPTGKTGDPVTTEDPTAQDQLMKQLDAMYAANDLSEMAYDTLTTSVDLAGDIHDLIGKVGEDELDELSRITSSAHNLELLTRGQIDATSRAALDISRNLHAAIDKMVASIRSARGGSPKDTPGAGGGTFDLHTGRTHLSYEDPNVKEIQLGPTRVFHRDGRVVATSGGGARQVSVKDAQEWINREKKILGIGARGAMVTRPTMALIGEDGPEEVRPLDQMPGAHPLTNRGGGMTVVININAPIYGDPEDFKDVIMEALEDRIRLQGGLDLDL